MKTNLLIILLLALAGGINASPATRKARVPFVGRSQALAIRHRPQQQAAPSTARIDESNSLLKREPLLTKTQWIASTTTLIGLSAASWHLQHLRCAKCIEESGQFLEECKLFEKETILSFLLIFTHLIPFALIPLTMYTAWKQTPFLMQQNMDNKAMHPFALLLGLTFVGFGCAFEFGKHVSEAWYYRNSFDLQNYMFYFFLISSFALWADGFYSSKVVDLIFAASILTASVLYPIGATLEANAFKGAIYCALTLSFYHVTVRGKNLLQDWRMLWVPFFSVGVNLFFVGLLQNADKDGKLTRWNYIWHICHDLLGTEMGTAVFAYLIHDNPRHCRMMAAKRSEPAIEAAM